MSNFKLNTDLIYPIGSIYMSIQDTNPSVFFGGTWERINSRFLIASGTATGENGESYNFQVGQTGGEYSHTLTVDEIPSHTHTPVSGWGSGSSSNSFSINVNGTRGYFLNTGNTGGGKAHNNLPPFLVVNMWKRTA